MLVVCGTWYACVLVLVVCARARVRGVIAIVVCARARGMCVCARARGVLGYVCV